MSDNSPLRIQLITNLFAPDELGGAALYTDMARFLKERGHDIRVTTTFSYYPAWALRPEDQGISVRDEMMDGIPVRRVAMYVPAKVTGKSRMLSDLSFLLSLVRRSYYKDWKPQVVVTAIPMLSECLAQRFMYVGQGIPRLIAVKDFVVDSALELGILKLPLIGGVLRWTERYALRSAQTISTIGPQMLDKLKPMIGNDRRMVLIPDWIHQSLEKEINLQLAEKRPRAQIQLVYSGNLGIKQGLPDFLDQFAGARALNPGLKWGLNIYGGGANKEALEAAVAANPAVQLGGVQDEVAYVRNLLTASACLITQKPGVGANFLPSKILPALATGTPVLAVCDTDSPLGREVAESGCGEVVKPADAAALNEVLQRWQDQPEVLAKLSLAAKARAAHYERSRVVGLYESEIRRLAEGTEQGSATPALPVSGKAG
jgi:colanic acid biosynthesis glycosyl transferase WcaI